jgi:hypothetical protein
MKEYLPALKKRIFAGAKIVYEKIKGLGKAFKREAHETEIASKILMKMVHRKKVTPEEVKFLKDQSIDIGKALALIGLQAVPGSSVAIIAIEKVARKYGHTLFPEAQIEPSSGVNNDSDTNGRRDDQNGKN